MLRALVLLLIVANVGYWGWSQGWLGRSGPPEREPQRLTRQIQPQSIEVTPWPAASASQPEAPASSAGNGVAEAVAAASAAPAAPASTPSPAGTAGPAPNPAVAEVRRLCLETRPYEPADVAQAEGPWSSLGDGVIARQVVPRPGVYLVYMGAFVTAEARQKKDDELKRLKISAEPVSPPGLGPGLSLGRHSQREAAEAALAALSQRGVRSARVVTLVEPVNAVRARIETTDEALVKRALALNPKLPLGGFAACPPTPGLSSGQAPAPAVKAR